MLKQTTGDRQDEGNGAAVYSNNGVHEAQDHI
jgi:hypothetical protein